MHTGELSNQNQLDALSLTRYINASLCIGPTDVRSLKHQRTHALVNIFLDSFCGDKKSLLHYFTHKILRRFH